MKGNFNLFDAAGDEVFPTIGGGIMESASSDDTASGDTNPIDDSADATARSQAMSAVLTWVEEGDSSANALDELIMGVADIDGDYEIGDDEEAIYNSIWANVPDAMATIGGPSDADMNALCNDMDDAAGARVMAALSGVLDADDAPDDDSLIQGFANGEDALMECVRDGSEQGMILEATYKKMKIVRGGKLVVAKKRVSGTVRLSAAQKAGLKKARRKAFSSASKMKRAKSLRIRKRRGM